MDAKVLYTNAEIEIQCVAVKPLEVVRRGATQRRGSTGTPQRRAATSLGADTLFLQPQEGLYAYLYVGAADGTLLAMRFHTVLAELPVTGGGVAHEHRVALEAQSKTVAVQPQSSQALSSGAASQRTGARAGRGVQAMEAPAVLPYLFAIVHGRFVVYEDDTLQPVDAAYTAPLRLDPAVAVLCLCAGEEQAASAAQASVSAAPAAAAFYALLLQNCTVVLIECGTAETRRLPLESEPDVADAAGRSPGLREGSSAALPAGISVPPGTSTMAWCRHLLLTGSPDVYCLYDTTHGTLLSRLEAAPLLRGCAPYAAYFPRMDTGHSSGGERLADAVAAAVETHQRRRTSMHDSAETELHLEDYAEGAISLTPTHSSGDSSSDGWSGASDDCEGGDVFGEAGLVRVSSLSRRASALVFRLQPGVLHACVFGDGAPSLSAALPLGTGGGTEAALVHAAPPFVLIQRGGGEAEAPHQSPSPRTRDRRPLELDAFSCLGGGQWATDPTAGPLAFVGAAVRTVRVFTLGLLGVSRHMVEALLWRPLDVQLEAQVERDRYARALRLAAYCGRSSTAALARGVCLACATHAMARRHYRLAFSLHLLADPSGASVLRLFPEFRLPLPTAHGTEEGDGVERPPQGVGVRPLSYSSSAPYRALYRVLLTNVFASTAASSAQERVEEEGVRTREGECASTNDDKEVASTSRTGAGQSSPAPPPACVPPASGASTALTSPVTAAEPLGAALELALFCLVALDSAGVRRVGASLDEVVRWLGRTRTLDGDTCEAALAALGLASVAPLPSVLLALLRATHGAYDAALRQCRDNRDVEAAGAVLLMHAHALEGSFTATTTTAEPPTTLTTLYQLHLPWMLEADPAATVQLLTAPATYAAPRRPDAATLLPLLLAFGGAALLDYLRYLIEVEGSTEAAVHQLYALHLIQTLRTLREEWGLQGFASPELGAEDGAGSETGIIGHLRRALLGFLQGSVHFDKERVLAALEEAGMLEEQCLVLEALQDHIGALSIFVYRLQDVARAVLYCEARDAAERAELQRSAGWRVAHASVSRAAHAEGSATPASWATPAVSGFDADALHGRGDSAVEAVAAPPFLPSRACRQALMEESGEPEAAVTAASWGGEGLPMSFNPYLHLLLHVLLVPPAPSQPPALEEAIWLLRTHAPAMSAPLALASLPGDLPVSRVAPYLVRAFQRLELQHEMAQLEAAAAQSALADAVRRHTALRERCLWLESSRRCVVCGDGLDTGGLVTVFPNLKPAHLRCHRDTTVDPERGVPFASAAL